MTWQVRDRETVYQEKKTLYQNAKAGIDAELVKVQSDADDAAREAAHEESQQRYYECAASIERVKLKRIEDEKAGSVRRSLPGRDGAPAEEYSSYRELYAAKIRQQEALSKQLREQQKAIKANVGGNVKQVKMFRDLHKLLRVKMDAQQRARQEAADMLNAEGQDTNIFTMPEGDEVPGGGGGMGQAADIF
jgi:intraflagellar transport protein 81